jgi:hypothetical protein
VNQRIGTNGGWSEVLSHPWLADIDQEALAGKQLVPEFKPEFKNILQGDPETIKRGLTVYNPGLDKIEQKKFAEFDF